jgi:hypothetical protein
MKLFNGRLWLLFSVTSVVLPAQTTAVQPYSFTAVATQLNEAGEARPEYRIFHAVNSAGASVAQDLSPGAGGVRQILNNGLQTIVDPARRSAVSAPLGGRQPTVGSCADHYRMRPDVIPVVQRDAARIGGVAVDRVTLEFSEGQGRVELLMAPSLGCVILDEKSFRAGRLIRQVETTDLRLREPDPSLFEIPFGYTYTKVEREMKK